MPAVENRDPAKERGALGNILRTERAHATASRGQVIPVPSFSVSACHVTVISDLQSDPGLWLAPDLAMGTGPSRGCHTARHRRTGGVEEEGPVCLHVDNSFRFLPASFLSWPGEAYCSGNELRLCASKYSK